MSTEPDGQAMSIPTAVVVTAWLIAGAFVVAVGGAVLDLWTLEARPGRGASGPTRGVSRPWALIPVTALIVWIAWQLTAARRPADRTTPRPGPRLAGWALAGWAIIALVGVFVSFS